MRHILLPAALLLCLARSASAAASPAQPPLDACTLLNQQTASALYGAPVTAAKGQAAAANSMMMCLYGSQKGGEATSLLVQVLPTASSGSTMMDAVTKSSHATPVSGLGERAVYTSDSAALMLSALLHGKLIVLGVTGPDTPARRAAMLPVMQQILTKL